VTDNQPSGISKFRIHRGRRRVRRDKRWRLRPLFLVCTPRNRLWVNAGALEAKDKRYSLFQIGGPLIFLPRRKNLWVTEFSKLRIPAEGRSAWAAMMLDTGAFTPLPFPSPTFARRGSFCARQPVNSGRDCELDERYLFTAWNTCRQRLTRRSSDQRCRRSSENVVF